MRSKTKSSTKKSAEPDETEDDVTTGLGDVTLGDQPDAEMNSPNGSDDEEEEEETIPMGGGTGRVPRRVVRHQRARPPTKTAWYAPRGT